MFFSRKSLLCAQPPLHFMGKQIEFVKESLLLGIPLSESLSDKCVSNTVQKFYRKSNELRFDFNSLPCDVKSSLFTTFCLDAYGSQLWNYDSKTVNQYYVAWRKVVRLLWRLPNTTHCNLLHTINGSLPIEVALEKRCI